jgi:hypothetical protein
MAIETAPKVYTSTLPVKKYSVLCRMPCVEMINLLQPAKNRLFWTFASPYIAIPPPFSRLRLYMGVKMGIIRDIYRCVYTYIRVKPVVGACGEAIYGVKVAFRRIKAVYRGML